MLTKSLAFILLTRWRQGKKWWEFSSPVVPSSSVQDVSRCTPHGINMAFPWSFIDSLELKWEHLKLYIKCQERQPTGTISIFDDVWLAGRHRKHWPWQQWHTGCFALTQPRYTPRAVKGVEELCLCGRMCLQIRETIVQQNRAISHPLPSLFYSEHVHLLACAISMSKLRLGASLFTVELVSSPFCCSSKHSSEQGKRRTSVS